MKAEFDQSLAAMDYPTTCTISSSNVMEKVLITGESG
jgi:hypothetical protein